MTHIVSGVSLLVLIYHLGQMAHIFSYCYLTPICLVHPHFFHLFIFLNIIVVLLTLRELSVSARFFKLFLNLQFPKLASTIPTIATPLNAKPPTPLYFYPLYIESHQEEQ